MYNASNKLNMREAFPLLLLSALTLLREMVGINEFGMVLPFLSLTSQFTHKAKVITSKRIAQLVKI